MMSEKELLRSIKSALPGRKLGVAVSGGADSVALLRLLVDLSRSCPLNLTVLHVDHSLRPDSPADAAWVKELSSTLRLQFLSKKLSAPTYSDLHVNGPEAWARAKRHEALVEMCRMQDIPIVCLGHHAQDQAETLLLRLIRGTSIQGMGAMRPLKRLKIGQDHILFWRPLLTTPPEALRAWLQKIGQDWREDHTNQETRFLRNRIRHQLLPLLETLRPNISQRLGQVSQDLNQAHVFLKKQAKSLLIHSTSTRLLLPEKFPTTAIFLNELVLLWLTKKARVSPTVLTRSLLARFVDLLLRPSCGRKLLVGETQFVRTPEGIEKLPAQDASFVSLTCQSALLEPGTMISFMGGSYFASGDSKTGTDGIWFDPGSFSERPVIRCRQPGDRFSPKAGGGTKKLARWLIDQKIPSHLRNQLPVIAIGNEILWIPDHGISSKTFSLPQPGFIFIGRKT